MKMAMGNPKWQSRIPQAIVQEAAKRHRLEPEFLLALIQTESSGNRFAVRSEFAQVISRGDLESAIDVKGKCILAQLWRYPYYVSTFAERLGCTLVTEQIGQATSWGPCQVMGAVAREHGFTGWFPELCDWECGVEFGSRHVARMAVKWGTEPSDLYAAYNAGSVRKTPGGLYENQRHVDHFMRNYRELTGVEK